MKKHFIRKFLSFLLVFQGVILIFLVIFYLISGNQGVIPEAKAFSCGVGLPAAAPEGVEGLQNKINSAKNGDIIELGNGTYSGPTALPLGLGEAIFVSDSRGASQYCMLRIEGKTLTLKGKGPTLSIIYGEGHARPYQDPYQHRGGICIINSNVTLDNVRIKEFQKRCVVVYNSSIVVKNSIIEGCDEGGVSLLGDSSGLFVNNFFQFFNFGGIMLWQNSTAKIVNNILNGANIAFFFHPKTPDTANAEIINNIFSSNSKIVQVGWWPSEASKLQNIKISYNLFDQDSAKCTPPLEYCTNFTGKLTGDPLYTEPVGDMCGVASWGNFTLKEGSPALGVGDPSIPGVKTLGNAGGPCTDTNSSICSSYISQNTPKPPEPPTPTPPPPTAIPPTSKPAPTDVPLAKPPQTSSSKSSLPPPISPSSTTPPSLLIVENMGFDRLTIQGLFLETTYVPINKTVESGKAIEYPVGNICSSSNKNVPSGILFINEKGQITYTNISVSCGKVNIFDIQ